MKPLELLKLWAGASLVSYMALGPLGYIVCEREFTNINPYIGAGLLSPTFIAVVIFVAVMSPSDHGSEYRGY